MAWPSPQLCVAVTGAAQGDPGPYAHPAGEAAGQRLPLPPALVTRWPRRDQWPSSARRTLVLRTRKCDRGQERQAPRPAAAAGSRRPPSLHTGCRALAHESGHSGLGQTGTAQTLVFLFRGVYGRVNATSPGRWQWVQGTLALPRVAGEDPPVGWGWGRGGSPWGGVCPRPPHAAVSVPSGPWASGRCKPLLSPGQVWRWAALLAATPGGPQNQGGGHRGRLGSRRPAGCRSLCRAPGPGHLSAAGLMLCPGPAPDMLTLSPRRRGGSCSRLSGGPRAPWLPAGAEGRNEQEGASAQGNWPVGLDMPMVPTALCLHTTTWHEAFVPSHGRQTHRLNPACPRPGEVSGRNTIGQSCHKPF